MAIVKELETPEGVRRKLQISSTQTLEPMAEFEVATAEDVNAAVEVARKAQERWGALPIAQRTAVLQRALQALLEKQEEVMDLVVRETGKARQEALMMEVWAAADIMHFYAKNAARFLKPESLKLHGIMRFLKKAHVEYHPLGVVGVISPWNGPFILSMNPTVQALMAGNTVILKPSEVTPFSGRFVLDIFQAAGLPEGVLQVVLGDGETGAALTASSVDKISFTGSVDTGRLVGMACAQSLIPCSLELGGKDAMIVCADAEVEFAAAGAVGGSCLNSGHYCCGTERVYVVDSIADDFIERVVENTKALRQGKDGEYDVGSVFWDKQMSIIESHMQDALDKGATVLVGGRRNPNLEGFYYEPTVIVDCTHDMDIIAEETFGPIVAIIRVKDEQEAIRMANDTRFGLGGNVWTKDSRRGARLAAQLKTGSGCVNDMTMTFGVPEAPFGGRKESGVSQVNGKKGLQNYCHAMPIIVDRLGGRQAPKMYPYTKESFVSMQKTLNFLWGTRIGRWLA